MLTVHLGRKGRGVRVEGSNSPARLARSLVRNLDEPFVQRQIVADGVLPAGIASVVDSVENPLSPGAGSDGAQG